MPANGRNPEALLSERYCVYLLLNPSQPPRLTTCPTCDNVYNGVRRGNGEPPTLIERSIMPLLLVLGLVVAIAITGAVALELLPIAAAEIDSVRCYVVDFRCPANFPNSG